MLRNLDLLSRVRLPLGDRFDKYAPARTAPLLYAGTGPAYPGRHARRLALAVRPAAVALRAAPSGGARSVVVGPELRRRRADHHGEDRQGGPLSRGPGPSRDADCHSFAHQCFKIQSRSAGC